ncbi:MAG TPA: sigma 54-interacting transcriptional regulator [Polyangiaceae bacterium]|nr:MAG: Transcriptional regulatory protein ZraR [Deltaproteobacteria bacterium ADurb.Bin207]HNS98633.1 sigma 54-interacting transcriptional regulator [Polyangiaceae bacterium]HNZ21634.1 sigma 54-interacting transcriptional regulator [Polyangiaceae bacterium]HOD25066.1 sigma 54-interacting transcriptional regulator [Polyangiaceae bacterium]HOE48591.1 sigma 54-interacting transcriptional regulator [Polyangiaceae bacterium]
MQPGNPSEGASIRAVQNHVSSTAESERTEGASISSVWRGTILDSIADGVFTVDEAWRITSFNRAAETITGYSRQQVMGRPCYEIFQTSLCQSNCALKKTMDTGLPVINVAVEARGKGGEALFLSVSTAILQAPDGRRVGGVETFRDLSSIGVASRFSLEQSVLEGLVGRHPAMQGLADRLPDVAGSDAPVLVEGPEGSGKTLLTRSLHELSSRRLRPCVRVCCSALPESLLAFELFGGRDHYGREAVGRVRLAAGGSLVLDEVSALSPGLQRQILRLVRDQVFEPQAGAVRRADVRVLACSRTSLEPRVASGSFLPELFEHLRVVRMTMPSLMERREDIPRLADHFLRVLRRRTGKAIRGVSEEAMSLLMSQEYPANVRDLENAIEHAFMVCHGEVIEPHHWPDSMLRKAESYRLREPVGFSNPRQAAEAEVIRQVLERHRGNRLAAARELAMHRTTLWRKLKQYGMASD